jgi:hypothetical protein
VFCILQLRTNENTRYFPDLQLPIDAATQTFAFIGRGGVFGFVDSAA